MQRVDELKGNETKYTLFCKTHEFTTISGNTWKKKHKETYKVPNVHDKKDNKKAKLWRYTLDG